MPITSESVVFSEISSLYAVAGMGDKRPSGLPFLQNVEEEIALANAWTKARRGHRDPAEMQSCKDLHGVDEWASESSIPYRASDHRELLDKIRQTVKQNIPSPSPSAAETSIPCISGKDYHRCGRGIDEPSYRWAFTQLKKDTSFTVEQVNSAMVSPTQVDMAEVGTPVVIVPITDKGRGTYGKGLPGCQGVRGVVNLPFERAVLRL
ncbi:hypothetical protein LTR37_006684 [Vermiconidia calcicola]|uniref:Uncharacterized protein n=1 Tax=Vermiconidia calcicola TaxID=1690605 RepID=A0ACC3NH36_9PEZI|nr:hypothetical protein LTR37_006684 [Vermiconidia calcicola]